MWRTKAVVQLLSEELAGCDSDGSDLGKARLKAGLLAAASIAAVVVLLATYRGPGQQLTLGPSEQSVFSLGLIVVTLYAGARLARFRQLGRIRQLVEELRQRSEE